VAKEETTLEIVARVKDQMTKVLKRMGRVVRRIIKASFLAPFKLMGRALKGLTTGMLALGGALVGVFAIWRGGAWASSVIDAADSMNKLAQATGANVTSLSELEVAMEFAGVGTEKFRVIMTGLGRATAQALRGAPLQADAFRDLGVSMDLLKSGDVTGIFEQMARGLEKFNTEAEKGEKLYPIFPDNFLVLLPLLKDLEKNFLKNVNAARAFGAGLSEGLANVASDTKDDLLKVNIALKNIAREGILGVAKELAPVIKGFANFLRLNKEGLSEALASAIRLLAEALFALGKALIFISANLPHVRESIIDLFDVAIVPQKWLDALKQLIGADGLDGVRTKMTEVAKDLVSFQAAVARSLGPEGLEEVAATFRKEMGREPDAKELQQWAEARAKDLEGMREAAVRAREALAELNEEFEPFDKRAREAMGLEASTKEIDAAVARAKLALSLENLPGGVGGFANFLKDLPGISRAGEAGERGDIESTESAFQRFFSTFGTGISKAVDAWGKFEAAGAQAGQNLVDSLGNNLAAALTDIITGTKKASEAFKDMARAILEDIARIISRLIAMQIIQAAGSALGFALGGVTRGGVQSTVPIRSLARGGVVDRPTLAMFGEAGQEAFVPLASGKIPVRLENEPSRIPEMNITIHAMDGADVRRVLTRERGFLQDLQLNALVTNRQMRETVKGASR
jgi:hypothetical protein